MKFDVGDSVLCTVFYNIEMADGSFEPRFSTHSGIVLSITPKGYEVWGPGGEQSRVVGAECLKLIKKGNGTAP